MSAPMGQQGLPQDPEEGRKAVRGREGARQTERWEGPSPRPTRSCSVLPALGHLAQVRGAGGAWKSSDTASPLQPPWGSPFQRVKEQRGHRKPGNGQWSLCCSLGFSIPKA